MLMRIRGYKVSVTAQIGIVIVVINLLVALFAPLIAPFDQATPIGDAWADPTRNIGLASTISAATS